jgi:Lanthionine-containing peptide SapB precursor RamS
MAMEIVLDLQKLEVPNEEDLFGNSSGSSVIGCCDDNNG